MGSGRSANNTFISTRKGSRGSPTNDEGNQAADHQEQARAAEDLSNTLTVESPEK
jgi:hypothetical protein